MDAYGAALFLHLLAILAASGASALVHLAESRIVRAAGTRERLEWYRFAGAASRTFPLAILALVATGGFMVSWQHRWAWDLGWVRAGVVGSVLLMVIGGTIGARSQRFAAALAEGTASGTHDPVARTLGWTSTCLALGIVFAMAVKPGTVGAFAALAAFALLGATIGASRSRATARVSGSVAA